VRIKIILFTILILISSLLYFNEIFAINENNKNLILNASSRIFDNNNNNISFLGHISSNITNISNNNYDSVYGQIAAIDNNVYIVWQDIISQKNQDIFITNTKYSMQANKIINLSNNSGISECPSIAISNNNIYVILEDFTPGNHEILFTKEIINSNNK
jgi:hypothetical protein